MIQIGSTTLDLNDPAALALLIGGGLALLIVILLILQLRS